MPHGRTVGEDSRWKQPFRKTVANRSPSADGFETKFINPVPKKTKNAPATSADPVEAESTLSPSTETLKKAQSRKRSAAPPKTAAKKVPAKKKSKAPTARKTTAAKKPAKNPEGPSDTDIQLRAYFLAERRMQLGLPGDSSHDWLEARKQLIEEAAQEQEA